MKNNVMGFVEFMREQGVMGLAIGFILGGAVSDVVASFVGDIVNPIIGIIFGSSIGLSGWSIGAVHIGSFIAVLIDFVIVAAVVYYIFMGLKLDSADIKLKKVTRNSGIGLR